MCRPYLNLEKSGYLKLQFASVFKGFPGGSGGKESACDAGDPGLIPGLESSPGEGNSYPLYYSCLDNSMDRGAWWAIGHGVVESDSCVKSSFSYKKGE